MCVFIYLKQDHDYIDHGILDNDFAFIYNPYKNSSKIFVNILSEV